MFDSSRALDGTSGAEGRAAGSSGRPSPAVGSPAADLRLGALIDQVRGLGSVAPDSLDDDALFDAVRDLERARRFLDAAEAHLLAELDERGSCDRSHGLRTARWLAREAALPGALATQRVKVARTLRTALGSVDEALTRGEIGWDHARAVVDAANPRIVDMFDDEATELLGYATTTVFERWRRDVGARAEELDVDGGHDPAGDLLRNRLSVGRTFGGTVHVEGKLVGEHGLIVEQAVERRADELFRRYHSDREQAPELTVPSRSTLRALALAELCRHALAVDPSATRAPEPDITLVVNAVEPEAACTPDGTRLPDGSVGHLLCDPVLTPIVVSSLGVPLAMGRQVRFATNAQRRAMAQRDQGCVFPGCDAPATWTDAHHIDRWHDEHGRTDVERMASLCRHHHGVTHRSGWSMHATVDGWFWWSTPGCATFWSQRAGRQRTGATPAPHPPDP